MHYRFLKITTIAVCAALIQSCSSSLTEKDEDVTVTLDSFNLVGTSSGFVSGRAQITGNPACTAANTSLNALLAQVDNYDDFDNKLESLDINEVRYRITRNDTPTVVSGEFQMTDPTGGQLITVASVSIPANGLVTEWTTLPFVGNGESVAQHYMDNLDDSFLYCAEGSPNSSELSLTMELQLDLTVTIDVL